MQRLRRPFLWDATFSTHLRTMGTRRSVLALRWNSVEWRGAKVILATKCGRYGRDDFDFSQERIRDSAKESLRRLKTTYLDILQLHDIEFVDEDQIVNEAVPALQKLKEAFIGITGLPLQRLKGIIERIPPKTLDVIISYCHYCLIDTTLDVQYFKERSIAVINASALSMGLLTKAGPPDWHPAPQGMKEVVRSNAELLSKKGFDIALLGIKWAILQNTDIAGKDSRV